MMNNKDKEALYDMQSMAFGSKMEKLVADKALTDEETAIQHQERYFYQQRRKHSSSGEVVVRGDGSKVVSKGTPGRGQNNGNLTPIPKTAHQQHDPQQSGQNGYLDKADVERKKPLDSLLLDIQRASADQRLSKLWAVEQFFTANPELAADNYS